MEIDDFLHKVRNSKYQCKQTGLFNLKGIPNPDKTIWKIVDANNEGVIIHFNSTHDGLTVFEAGLLYNLWLRNTRPADYASYHKCKAGQEFIANLKKVESIGAETDESSIETYQKKLYKADMKVLNMEEKIKELRSYIEKLEDECASLATSTEKAKRIDREKLDEWEKSMNNLLQTYRHVGLGHEEVLEYIVRKLGFALVKRKGKAYELKLRSWCK